MFVETEFCFQSDGSERDGSVLKDRQVGLTDISCVAGSMSTLNFAEELDFRLIFEDDGRQTAGTCHFGDVS